MIVKRLFDLAVAVPALAAAAPLLGGLAALVRLDSRGAAFYAGERIGRGRRVFRAYKLRTMVAGADRRGGSITGADDPRITRLGALLRATKLDELPQLWNVVRGDMSLVGPRPEVAAYVALYPPEWEPILSVRPGLTDPATLAFHDEQGLLADFPAADRERAYVEVVMPAKAALALEGVARSSFWFDLGVLARTAAAVLRPARGDHPAVAAVRRALAERARGPAPAAHANVIPLRAP